MKKSEADKAIWITALGMIWGFLSYLYVLDRLIELYFEKGIWGPPIGYRFIENPSILQAFFAFPAIVGWYSSIIFDKLLIHDASFFQILYALVFSIICGGFLAMWIYGSRGSK